MVPTLLDLSLLPSSPSLHHCSLSRNQRTATLFTQKKCKIKPPGSPRLSPCLCCPNAHGEPQLVASVLPRGVWRRDLLLFGLSSSSLYLLLPSSTSGLLAEEDGLKMAAVVDEINAYTYSYPVGSPSKKLLFKWVESRKPERYSSAPPLSPDARLRIVSERVDLIDNLIISVSVGPPNSAIIKSKDKSTWTAKDVADSVLSYKSALRVTSSQRLSESSVLDAHSSNIDGEPYWYYEYLVRKSPTEIAPESNIFRRYIASTAERDGYLYSLSASTLNKEWDKMGPFLEKAVTSFRLLPPTSEYVPPYKDPWRFW